LNPRWAQAAVNPIAFADENYEEVFLVGFRLQPGPHEADLYALVLYYEPARGNKNRPLTENGRILFFRDVERADAILARGDAAFRKYRRAPVDVAYAYDLPTVLAELEGRSQGNGAAVLDFINELLDFIEAASFSDVEPQISVLRRLADALTFNSSLHAFHVSSGMDPRVVLAATHWGIGAVLSRAMVVE
jgi:hypothetical protein